MSAEAPKAALLWPIRFAAASYALRVTMGGTTSDLSFPAAGSLTVGRDYWVSGDGQTDGLESDGETGRGDLLKMLQDTLDSHASAATATVTVNASGFVEVTVSTGTLAILWAHANTTLDGRIFGFTGDTSEAATVTASNKPKGRWFPGRAITEDTRDRQPIVGAVKKAISGRQRVSRIATPSTTRGLFFAQTHQERVLTEYAGAAAPYSSLEYAWTNSLSLGQPFRIYTDESAVSSPTYSLRRIESVSDPISRSDSFQTWWDISLPPIPRSPRSSTRGGQPSSSSRVAASAPSPRSVESRAGALHKIPQFAEEEEAPPMAVAYHDTTHGPAALWQLDGNLLDSSGNGNTLRLRTGTESYADLMPGVRGFQFDGSTGLDLSTTPAGLLLLGDITIELFVTTVRAPGAVQMLVGHGGTTDSAADNYVYSLQLSAKNYFNYFAEHTNGTDIAATNGYNNTSGILNGPINHVTLVRSSGQVSFYVNGMQSGPTSTFTGTFIPTSGGSGRIQLGSTLNTANPFIGGLASVKLIASALSAGQVLDEYNRTIGRMFPRVAA